MDDFDLELKQSFIEEAVQGLDDAEKAFLRLENEKDNPELLDELFRLAHNLKGTSMAVGFDEVGDFTHKMEDLILKLKEGDVSPTDEVVGVLLECNDHLRMMVDSLQEDISATFDSAELIGKIIAAGNSGDAPAESPAETPTVETAPPTAEATPPAFEAQAEPPVGDEVHPSDSIQAEQQNFPSIEEILANADKIEAGGAIEPDAAAKADELAAPTPTAESKAETKPAEKPAEAPAAAKKESAKPAAAAAKKPGAGGQKKLQVDESVRVSLTRLEKLNNYVGELVILQNMLDQNRHDMNSQMMIKSISQLNKLSKEIHEMSMSLRMLPIKPTLMKLQRVVRDTSKALDKKVNLKLIGEETEVDKTVLENLNDPLIHIVRNAIDHGLESGETRIMNGKSEEGNVSIECFHRGNSLVILVKDDGGGINPEVIRKKAIEKGVIDENTSMSDTEIINLVFHPGFSTKEQVSEVSGRGVGMDVVKTNIRALNGEVGVKSKLGEGSVFQIELPLTMAIIDGMVAHISNQKFVIPLAQVHETIILSKDKIDYVTGGGEFLNLRGITIPITRLDRALKLTPSEKEAKIAVIVKNRDDFNAFIVNDLVSQQQVVVKTLGDEVTTTKAYIGSSILGDGMPALILDLQEIAKNQSMQKHAMTPPTGSPPKAKKEEKKTTEPVEDSAA